MTLYAVKVSKYKIPTNLKLHLKKEHAEECMLLEDSVLVNQN